MGNLPNSRKFFACNGEIASPGNFASFSTYRDMLDWANRAFKLGLSKADCKSACCEVLPRGYIPRYTSDAIEASVLTKLQRVDLTDEWSSSYQYYVFSITGATSSPVVLNYVALGELIL